eukprot:TRINITY_DN6107_c0_g1_i1.p1 TRINITY_DN6107_c0_g1~~TRINITY_DN6107_c0_g1_i1.p1  ORF type:complete len:294 (-),score=72.99 TRINITY_DN6107_c0_g1_i1:196-1077(-)
MAHHRAAVPVVEARCGACRRACWQQGELQWLWDSEQRRWDSAADGVGNVAALRGHTELLAWLNSIGALTDETLAYAAASHGHTYTLKWARASGFACGPMAVSAAAQGGHVAAFKWLVDADGGGCTVGPTICTDATFGGSVELLEWLRDRGMGRWDAAGMRSMLQVAGLAADPATARWLRDQGAPWPSALYALAVTSDRAVPPPHGTEDLAAAAEAVVAQPGNTVTFMCWRLPALRWAIAAGAPWGTWSAVVCQGLLRYPYEGIDYTAEVDFAHSHSCPCQCPTLQAAQVAVPG